MVAKTVVSDEKAANIVALFKGGMSKWEIARRLHMQWSVIDRICIGVPDPHNGQAQRIFTSAALKRRHVDWVPDFILSDADW